MVNADAKATSHEKHKSIDWITVNVEWNWNKCTENERYAPDKYNIQLKYKRKLKINETSEYSFPNLDKGLFELAPGGEEKV